MQKLKPKRTTTVNDNTSWIKTILFILISLISIPKVNAMSWQPNNTMEEIDYEGFLYNLTAQTTFWETRFTSMSSSGSNIIFQVSSSVNVDSQHSFYLMTGNQVLASFENKSIANNTSASYSITYGGQAFTISIYKRVNADSSWEYLVTLPKTFYDYLNNSNAYFAFAIGESNNSSTRGTITTIPYRESFYGQKDIPTVGTPLYDYDNNTLTLEWDTPFNMHYGILDYELNIAGSVLDVGSFWNNAYPYTTTFTYNGKTFSANISATTSGTYGAHYTMEIQDVTNGDGLWQNAYQMVIKAKGSAGLLDRGGNADEVVFQPKNYDNRVQQPTIAFEYLSGDKANVTVSWDTKEYELPHMYGYAVGAKLGSLLTFGDVNYVVPGSNIWYYKKYVSGEEESGNCNVSVPSNYGSGTYSILFKNMDTGSTVFQNLNQLYIYPLEKPIPTSLRPSYRGAGSTYSYPVPVSPEPTNVKLNMINNGDNTFDLAFSWKSAANTPNNFFNYGWTGQNIIPPIKSDNTLNGLSATTAGSILRWTITKGTKTYTVEYDQSLRVEDSNGATSYNLTFKNIPNDDALLLYLPEMQLKSYITKAGFYSEAVDFTVEQTDLLSDMVFTGTPSTGLVPVISKLPAPILEYHLYSDDVNSSEVITSLLPEDFTADDINKLWTIQAKLKNKEGWLTTKVGVVIANSETAISFRGCDRLSIRYNELVLPSGVSGTVEYRIKKKVDGEDTDFQNFATTSSTTFEDTEVAANKLYSYQTDIIYADLDATGTNYQGLVGVVDIASTTEKASIATMPTVINKEVTYNVDSAALHSILTLNSGELSAIKQVTVYRVNVTTGTQSPTTVLYDRDTGMDPDYGTITATTLDYWDDDASLQNCEAYRYTFVLSDDCDNDKSYTTDAALISADISNTFSEEKNLTATKGYYEDYVELEWDNENNSLVDAFHIYRALYYSDDESDLNWFKIESTGSGTHQYIDRTLQAGKLYKYKVVAEIPCNGEVSEITSHTVVGFRSPRGVISGHIEYKGGQEVKDVRVQVTHVSNSDRGSALLMENGDLLLTDSIANANIIEVLKGDFTFETWLQPEQIANGQLRYSLLAIGDSTNAALQLYNAGTGLDVMVTGGTGTAVTDFDAVKGEWHQYTVVADTEAGTFSFYHDGELKSQQSLAQFTSMMAAAQPEDQVYFLNGYNGGVDELRLWSRAKTADEVAIDYSRITHNQDNDLMVYYNFDEGVGVMAYDQSKNEDNIFNQRHALATAKILQFLKGNFIPTSDQLGYVGYTDEYGNHIVYGIRYTGSGESFKAIPNKGVHEFSPSSKVVYIGDNSRAVNGVDFQDISSFVVSGKVTFDEDSDPSNTSLNIPVDGGLVKVDGEAVIYQGEQVFTKEDGSFVIEVPIGEHLLTIEKDGHIFRNEYTATTLLGADSTYYKVENKVRFYHDFQEPISTLTFKDMTRVIVIGKVVGGLVEAGKDLIFGGTVNNIGVADITFKPQNTLYNSLETTVRTGTETGEYRIELLPINYIASAPVALNNTFSFDEEDDQRLLSLSKTDLVNLNSVSKDFIISDTELDVFEEMETLGWLGREELVNDTTAVVDSVRLTYPFHEKASFMYAATPKLSVFNEDGSFPLKGALQIVTEYDTLQVDTLGLAYPVFQQGDSVVYQLNAYEEYLNADSDSIVSRYPVIGEVLFQNNFASGNSERVSLTYETGDETSQAYYGFRVGEPNVVPPHLKAMSVELHTSTQVIPWDNGGTNVQQGYVVGARQVDGNFVTAGPDRVKWVLRDPPGSNSYAYIDEGSKLTEYSETRLTDMTKNQFEVLAVDDISIKKAVFFGLGAGSVEDIFKLDLKSKAGTGFNRDKTTNKTNAQILTTTTRQRIQTSAESDGVGSSADLFIGYAQNYKVGQTIGVEIQRNEDGTYGIDSLSVLGIQPADQTFFTYTQNHIRNYLIPDLVAIRNSYLENNPAHYTSHLEKDHPLYGMSNDSPVFGADTVSLPLGVFPATGYGGESYTFVPSNDFPMDSVYMTNLQIEEWISALRQNDHIKLLAKQDFDGGNTDNLLKDYSMSGGAEVSYEESFVASREYNDEWLDAYSGYFTSNTEGKLLILGYGVGFDQKSNFLTMRETSLKVGNISENSVKWGFVYSDPEQGDRINFKVTKPSFNRKKFDEMRIKEAEDMYDRDAGDIVAMTLVGVNYAKSFALTKAKVPGLIADQVLSTAMAFALMNIVQLNDDIVNEAFNDSTVSDFETPVFITEGGITACPHEDAEVSYLSPEYTDSNYSPVLLGSRTLQRDVPEISVGTNLKHQKIYNVPDDQPAVFKLNLSNLSESGDTRVYSLKVLQGSNPDGAQIKIDGIFPDRDFDIPAGTTLRKELTLERGATTLQYDSIMLVLHSPCQYWLGAQNNLDLAEIADTVYLSAGFLPTCSTPEWEQPEQNWVVNYDDGDLLELELGGYDINYYSLEKITLQYRRVGTTDWLPVTDAFYKQQGSSVSASGTTVYEYRENGITLYDSLTEKQWIPTSSATLSWQWDLSNVVDGEYEVRAVTYCHVDGQLSKEYTEVFAGTIDRELPSVFGSPSPSDGILGAGEELSISFNEDINRALLNVTGQLDIRGKLNYAEIKHEVSVSFDGLEQHVRVPFGPDLRSTSFTVEFWAKHEATGKKEIVISQGQQAVSSWEIGFDESNALYVGINGTEKVAAMPVTEIGWNHYAVSFNEDSKVVELFVNGIWNNNTYALPQQVYADGELIVGYGSYDQVHYFEGSLHELRIWNHARNSGALTEYMNATLSGQEAGLLGYWSMDELGESELLDKARHRNAEMNAAWELAHKGYAYDLSAIDSLSINASTIGFTSEQEYTIECWFKTNTLTSAATLLSNGKGTADDPNTQGWSVNLLADGSLQLTNNGLTLTAAGNYGDNQWHHFAMTYGELTGVSVYMDGKLAANRKGGISGFAGSSIYFGQRYFQNGTLLQLDQKMDGVIDEIRIWNTRRTEAQIRRYRHQALEGDELGLLVYFPFEQYRETSGIAEVTTDLESETGLKNTSLNISPLGNYFTQEGPQVSVQPAVQQVPFSYVANEREIIFTLNVDPALVEGTQLDISVAQVEDMFGNPMNGTKTWTAYIDQNQLIWNDNTVSLKKEAGEPLTFSMPILNKSGQVENYNISNLPSWLQAAPLSGLLDPQSYTTINFTVDADMSLGTFQEDIMLTGNLGYSEKLQLDLQVYREAPDWTVNESGFETTMHFIGIVKVGDIISTDSEDRLAAYVNGELRGSCQLKYIEARGQYMAFLTVFGNSDENSAISFKLWDASEGRIRAQLTPADMKFESNRTQGTISNPVVFQAREVFEQLVSLKKGWNWVSFYLEPDSRSLNDFFPQEVKQAMLEIKSSELTAQYSSNSQMLVGNMTEVEAERTYFIEMKEAKEFSYMGEVINPTLNPVPLEGMWNRIGYISRRNLLTAEALSSLNPAEGDLIKSRTAFAMYEPQLGWVGNLQYMVPGEGYMFYTTGTDTEVIYPESGMFDSNSARMAALPSVESPWSVDAYTYEGNMTAVIEVKGVEVSPQMVLGAFADGKCVGVSAPQFHAQLESPLFFISMQGSTTVNEVTFQLYDPTAVDPLQAADVMTFQTNAQVGTVKMPQPITFEEKMSNKVTAYPTIFNEEVTVTWQTAEAVTVSIEVVDLMGRVIRTWEMPEGNEMKWNGKMENGNPLPSGMYLMKVKLGTDSQTIKLIRQ
ncbi:LamG-like jellyroll fold domain-containing protein [Limibacter armeniacum]|uniref:LamG-like jellyroll fold domain-containing protein n=1 Tax=Limibacter armeniacum TaxID=466084 RepID=UPI002FE5BBD8